MNRYKVIMDISMIIVVIFILSQGVFGALRENTFFEGDTFTVRSGGDITVFDMDLNFIKSNNDTQIFVQQANSSINRVINKEACGTIGYLRVCFDRVSNNQIYARLFSVTPSLTLEHSLAKESVRIGEENNLNVTIKNSGDSIANQTSFSMDVPDKIFITDVEGAILENNKILFSEEIDDAQEHLIEIYFRPLSKYENIPLVSNLEYYNYFLWVSEEEETEQDSQDFLKLDYKTDPDKVYLGNPIDITFTIKNDNQVSSTNADEGYNMSIKSMEIFKDTDYPISDYDGFLRETTEKLYWQGHLSFNESREFSFSVTPKKSGDIHIPLVMEINDSQDDNLVEIAPKIILDVLSPRLDMVANLASNRYFNSSSTYDFDIVLENQDDVIEFSNVLIKVSNSEGSAEKTIDRIGVGTRKTVTDFKFQTPAVNKTISDEIMIEVSYENEFFEEKEIDRTIKYFVEPIEEIEFDFYVNKTKDGVFELLSYAKNLGEYEANDIILSQSLPEDFFLRGNPKRTLKSLDPAAQERILGYEMVVPEVNFSTNDYFVNAKYSYKIKNISKDGSIDINLSELILTTYPDTGKNMMQRTKEDIERVFSSVQVFMMFIASLIILGVSLTTFFMYKKQFTISGYQSLQKKQEMIEKHKKRLVAREGMLRKTKSNIDHKIHSLGNFMKNTKKQLDRELPIIEEKRDGLKTRQDDLMKEKKLVDDKIAELHEIERRLNKKNLAYQREKAELDTREKQLRTKFEAVKTRIGELNKSFEKLLSQEAELNKKKESLNSKELGVIAEKQRVVKMGDDTISSEKINVVQEKVSLEHERNSIEEELYSLENRRKDITKAQSTISKEQSTLQKEKNVFDSNRQAVEQSLGTLKDQSTKIKDILTESQHHYMNDDHGDDNTSSKSVDK